MSAPYAAVIECDPTESVDVVKVAVSGFNPLSVPVPMVVVPSLNVMVPDGCVTPENCGVTVAVKVKDSPKIDGFVPVVSVTVVVVLAWFTV